MSNKKQSSVEWLINEIAEKYNFRIAAFYSQEIQQAKELHRQEITDAYAEGAENEFAMGSVSRSDYYNNTYGKI